MANRLLSALAEDLSEHAILALSLHAIPYMQQATIQNVAPRTRTEEEARFRNRKTINTTLYDLIAAVADEVEPEEERLVAEIVSNILRSSRIVNRFGR